MSEYSDGIVDEIRLQFVRSHPTAAGGSTHCRSVHAPWTGVSAEKSQVHSRASSPDLCLLLFCDIKRVLTCLTHGFSTKKKNGEKNFYILQIKYMKFLAHGK